VGHKLILSNKKVSVRESVEKRVSLTLFMSENIVQILARTIIKYHHATLIPQHV